MSCGCSHGSGRITASERHGGILVADAARVLGLSRSEILIELLNIQAALLCRADGWSGSAVPIEQVERDFDGAFLLDSALAEGEPRLVNRYVLFSRTSIAIPDLIATGAYVGMRPAKSS